MFARPAAVLAFLLLGSPTAVAAPVQAVSRGPGADTAGLSPVVTAGNARGDAAVMWGSAPGTRPTLRIALARGAGRFGRPERIPGAHNGPYRELTMAMDAEGRLLAVWTYEDGTSRPGQAGTRDEGCCRRAQAAVRDARGRWGAVATVSRRGVSARLGPIDLAGGRAGVVFTDRDPLAPSVAFAGTGGGFRRARRLAVPSGASFVDVHAVAMGRSRPTLVLSAVASGSLVPRLVERRFSATGAALPDRTVRAGPLSNRTSVGEVELNARGDLLLTLSSFDPLAAETLSGRLGGRLVRAPIPVGFPFAALAGTGAGAVATTPSYDATRVEVLPRTPSGAFAPLQTIPTPSAAPTSVRGVAVSPAGRIATAFESPAPGELLKVRRGGRTTTFGDPDSRFATPPLQIDRAGRVRVVWVSADGIYSWRL